MHNVNQIDLEIQPIDLIDNEQGGNIAADEEESQPEQLNEEQARWKKWLNLKHFFQSNKVHDLYNKIDSSTVSYL